MIFASFPTPESRVPVLDNLGSHTFDSHSGLERVTPLHVRGDLEISECLLVSLPKVLRVDGGLIGFCTCTAVHGDLELHHCRKLLRRFPLDSEWTASSTLVTTASGRTGPTGRLRRRGTK